MERWRRADVGTVKGTLLVYPGLVAAGLICFWLSRLLARDWFARRIAGSPKFVAIDRAVAKGGWKMVLLLRMSPVSPFTLLSYSLGLTRVRVRDYVVGTLMGALPGTAVYVYLGAAVHDLNGAADSVSALPRALFWVGLAASVAAFVLITRRARTELKRIAGEPIITCPKGI